MNAMRMRNLMVAALALGTCFTAPAAAQDGAVKPGEARWHSFAFSPSHAEGSPAAFGQQAKDGEEPAPAPPRSGDWEFTLAPYLWMTSLRTTADVGPISATSEACFSELLKDLDMGAMLRFEGIRDDRWGFYLDGTYLSLGDDARARVGPFRIRGIAIDAQITQAWLDFGGMYRFGKQGRSFDLMLGGRYTHIGTEVSVGPFLDIDESKDAVSPVVGGRVQYDLSDKWVLSVRGDVGGFGVGDAVDLVWGATALLGYRLNEKTTLGFGYRYYDIDISSGRLDADMKMYGPMVGFAYRF